MCPGRVGWFRWGLPLLLCLVLVDLPSRAGDVPTAEELVRAYEQYLRAFDRATFSARMTVHSDSPRAPRDGPNHDSLTQYWRDGKRQKRLKSTTARYVRGGKTHTTKESGEWIFTEKWRLVVGHDDKGEGPRGIVARLGVPSDQERPENDPFSPFVDGRLLGDPLPLPETLRNCKLSVRKAEIEGRRHWVVEGTGKWGYHALWLDPDRGHLPVRVLSRKQGADWLIDKSLAGMPKEFGGPWSEYQVQVDATAVSVMAGRHVVTGCTAVGQTHHTGGKHTERYVISLSDINLNPDFSTDPFVPTVSIPDGFPVTIEGQEQIDHVWRNGRIVKRVSEGSVANLAGNWFQGGSMLGRGLLLLGLLAVVGLGVVLWLRRRRAVT